MMIIIIVLNVERNYNMEITKENLRERFEQVIKELNDLNNFCINNNIVYKISYEDMDDITNSYTGFTLKDLSQRTTTIINF